MDPSFRRPSFKGYLSARFPILSPTFLPSHLPGFFFFHFDSPAVRLDQAPSSSMEACRRPNPHIRSRFARSSPLSPLPHAPSPLRQAPVLINPQSEFRYPQSNRSILRHSSIDILRFAFPLAFGLQPLTLYLILLAFEPLNL
ncbi:hypothetical protein D1AOALGA4SA_9895 [Olavius algarvensis Delta 1 endosymbiont]|nr:hypothetical protein D1AOALGA4SA_9895 [Olavius algarvensis Delta 1 endosymbiont]